MYVCMYVYIYIYWYQVFKVHIVSAVPLGHTRPQVVHPASLPFPTHEVYIYADAC